MSKPITVNTQLLDEVDAGADAATGEEWHTDGDENNGHWIDAEDGIIEEGVLAWVETVGNSKADAKHIARMDPATSKALTARIRELEDKLEDMQDAMTPEQNKCTAKIEAQRITEDTLRAELAKAKDQVCPVAHRALENRLRTVGTECNQALARVRELEQLTRNHQRDLEDGTCVHIDWCEDCSFAAHVKREEIRELEVKRDDWEATAGLASRYLENEQNNSAQLRKERDEALERVRRPRP